MLTEKAEMLMSARRGCQWLVKELDQMAFKTTVDAKELTGEMVAAAPEADIDTKIENVLRALQTWRRRSSRTSTIRTASCARLANALCDLNKAVAAKPTDKIAKSVASVEKRLEAMLARFPTPDDVNKEHNILISKEVTVGLFGCCGFFAVLVSKAELVADTLGGGRFGRWFSAFMQYLATMLLSGWPYTGKMPAFIPLSIFMIGTFPDNVAKAIALVKAAGFNLKLVVEVLKDLMELGGASGPLAEPDQRVTDQGQGQLKIAEPKTLYFFHKMLFNHQLCSCLSAMKKQEDAMRLWETPVVAAIRRMDGVIISQTKSAVVPDVTFDEKDFESFRSKYKLFRAPSRACPRTPSSGASTRVFPRSLRRPSPTGLAAS